MSFLGPAERGNELLRMAEDQYCPTVTDWYRAPYSRVEKHHSKTHQSENQQERSVKSLFSKAEF